jgi:hypothetical protein
MSARDDGYVATALHDLKKVLLNSWPGKHFGTWRPDHACLADLTTQVNAAQQGVFARALGTKLLELRLENCPQTQLIWMHGVDLKDRDQREALKKRLSPELVASYLAITFADHAHKALYFWLEEGGQIEGVNWRCPWYYPFWGEKKMWTVQEAQQRFFDAAQRIRKRLDGGTILDAEFLVKLGEDLLSDFGDSTFLPVTSLHFHHQLSAAIYLMVMKEFEEKGGVPLGADRHDREVPAVSLELSRTVITLPPERLRYRLRDAMHLRKISQRLLIRLHQYLKEQYLHQDDLASLGFTYPRLSPFVFYGKEAVVVLNRRADDEAILGIAFEVAEETETPLKVQRQPLTLTPEGVQRSGKIAPPQGLAGQAVGVGFIRPTRDSPETMWAMPAVSLPQVAAHECASCHRPIAPGEQKTDLDDELCATCDTIRRGYRECPKCFALFPKAPECPLCGPLPDRGAPREPVGAGRLIRLFDDLGGERVAIIAVRIGATPEAMEIESELRLAQFREERIAAEEGVLQSCGLSANDVQKKLETAKALMPLVHGTGGVLEYLQAVLEIGRKQDEWQEWLAKELYGGAAEEAAAHFVYRSPALTVLLVAESFLPAAYHRIAEDLKTLHIAHRLDIVTCDTHYPLYDALSALFTGPGRTLDEAERPPEAKEAAREFRRAAQAAYTAWRASKTDVPGPNSPVISAHTRLYAKAKQAPGPFLTYRVLRGGQQRVFSDEGARQLLEAEPSRQSSAQLHALALLAEQLAALAPEGDEGARQTLLMDLDGRARYIAEDIKSLAASILQEKKPIEAAQHLRELARAIRP